MRTTLAPAIKADDRDESAAKRDDYADGHNDGDVTSRIAMTATTATSSAAALIVISSVVITMTPAVITFDATSCEYVGYHQVRRQRRRRPSRRRPAAAPGPADVTQQRMLCTEVN